ncbi:MAG TPA: GspE/PulE family protein [Roseiarcus sp.]|nr:GspE/PulE family protein [Roseiarcus sp.]
MTESGLGRSTIQLRQLWEASDISAHEFADEVAARYRLPRITLPQLIGARALISRFTPRFLREAAVFPFATDDGALHLAVADPSDNSARRAAEIELGKPLAIVIASFEDIATALSERLGEGEEPAEASADRPTASAEDSIDSLRDLASGAPVVRAFNDLMEKALDMRASDVHIEPTRGGFAVRMRVDGLLRSVPAPTQIVPQALISRIKIVSGLNIAERRLPQDGAARLRVARTEIDIRVATMPTQHGEAAVIRVLPRDRGLLEISKLGLCGADERKLRRALDFPHGMVVVTGPTGSGKTTTLATMLSALNTPLRKILTIEDPIEYELPGVNQSQVKPEIGLTFAAAMRAFVRQDPDVIMVGEVRDAETANIAIHAALTGHLVLTTLHTETAAAAAPRLIDLGIEGFLLKSTLRSIFAQRLVRVLCDRCKTQRRLRPADLAADPRYEVCGFAVGDSVFEPKGCERCGGIGYRGRIGVFEALEVTGEVRDLVGPQVDSHRLDEAAMRAGMTTMMADAVDKCRAGVTSVSEVLRVTTVR